MLARDPPPPTSIFGDRYKADFDPSQLKNTLNDLDPALLSTVSNGTDGYIPTSSSYSLSKFLNDDNNGLITKTAVNVNDFTMQHFDGAILKELKRMEMSQNPYVFRQNALRDLISIREYTNKKYFKNRDRFMREGHYTKDMASQMAYNAINGEMQSEIMHWKHKYNITGGNDDLLNRAVAMNEQNTNR